MEVTLLIVTWYILGFISFPIGYFLWRLYLQIQVWWKLYKSAKEIEKQLELSQ